VRADYWTTTSRAKEPAMPSDERPEDRPPDGHTEPAGHAEHLQQRAQPARIAVAEDDREMRSLVAEGLRKDGHEVTELVDGATLLVRIARQYRIKEPAERLDLVVSDIRMPVITGLAILKGLRDAHCTTPVILMTAFGDAATQREAEALDAVLFNKPFKLDVLRRTVRDLLARANAA
jgi:DNA-binding NtrC family response regulator